MSNPKEFDIYEDTVRLKKSEDKKTNRYSKYCDFIFYESSITPGIKLAMRILKPEKPSYILCTTHGWHMSINGFEQIDDAPKSKYLQVQIDMRGRAFSDGEPDCNGYELYDIYDAAEYVKKHYSQYIIDDSIIYFEAGSGGGGNCYELISKFPDYFAAATALFGITDYAKWYNEDAKGEFKDEMDIWVGCTPDKNQMAYDSRSGILGIENLHTPLFIAHGEFDIRVPVSHAENYINKAKELGKGDLINYYCMQGVGNLNHWGNVTKEQTATVKRLSEENRVLHKSPINLAPSGRLIVKGYLVTKKFSVFLDSIDKVAVLDYDINQNKYTVTSSVPLEYKIEVK